MERTAWRDSGTEKHGSAHSLWQVGLRWVVGLRLAVEGTGLAPESPPEFCQSGFAQP